MNSAIEIIKSDITATQKGASDALEKAKKAIADAESSGYSSAIKKADNVEKEAERLEGLIEALQSRVAALEAVNNASQEDLNALDPEVKTLQDYVSKLFLGKVNNMITGISFDFQGDDWPDRERDLNFSATFARVNYTFGNELANAITFVKGESQATDGVKLRLK